MDDRVQPPRSSLTVSEAAAIRGVSRQTIIRAIHRGLLHAERVGRAYLIRAESLDGWPVQRGPGGRQREAPPAIGGESWMGAGQLRAVIDSLADAVFVVCPAGRVLHANSAAIELAGECASGQPVAECLRGVQLHQPDGAPTSLAELGLGQILRGEPCRGRLAIWRRNGQLERVVSLSGGPVRDTHGHVAFGVCVVRDVTERRQQARDREAVAALALALVEDLSLDGVIQRVLDEVRSALSAHAVAVTLISLDGKTLEVASGRFQTATAELLGRVSAGERCFASRAFETGELQVVEDVSQLGDAPLVAQEIAEIEGVRSLLAAPLRDRRGTIGVLVASFVEPRQFSARELKLATTMADISAAAIQNARLYRAALQRERRSGIVGQALAAISSTIDVDQAPRRLVDVLRRAFGADQAWLLYPCDPTAATVQVRYEATTPEYPGSREPGAPLPTEDLAYLLGRALERDRPLAVDLADPAVPEAFRALMRRFHVQSLLAVRFRPRADRTWLLGLHQCSYRRVWSAEERSILAEIAGYAAVAIEHVQLHRQIREALRIREEFISSAAHELKTPVTALKGYSQVLLRAPTPYPDEFLRRALRAIDQGADRITRLVHDLLEVASLEVHGLALRRIEFDLGELAQSVVADAELTARGHRLTCRAALPVRVVADRDRIADVLFSLIDNALKYSPPDSPVEVGVARRGAEAVASVRDHGHGIPEERWPHLFEPLYEPHPPGGIGYVGQVSLGLYMARRVVEQHGGRVWFESKEGVGSTFYVALPTVAAGASGSSG